MEGTSENEVKLRLKIIVDKETKTVVFAEAGKDFVDFLFHMLSLPLATIVKLLNDSNKETKGCLPTLLTLCKSVESLSCEYFEQNVNKDSVLLPKLPVVLPLLSLNHTPASLTYFKCPKHGYISDHQGETCPDNRGCNAAFNEVTLSYVQPSANYQLSGFVKKPVCYMVMDNLEVKPMSISLIKSHVTDFNDIVQKKVVFGLKEALALLRASLETDDVLTTVFLQSKK